MIPEAGKGACVGGVYSGQRGTMGAGFDHQQLRMPVLDTFMLIFRALFSALFGQKRKSELRNVWRLLRSRRLRHAWTRTQAPSGEAATRADGVGLGSRSRMRPLEHLCSSLGSEWPGL